jgi:hypothetical protein
MSYCANPRSPYACGQCVHFQQHGRQWGICSIHIVRDRNGYGQAIDVPAPMNTFSRCCFQFQLKES